jgi:predicted RNase H-like HicB family nuclease
MSRIPSRNSALRIGVAVVVEPDGEGFHAYAPALQGLHVDGESEKEALENAVDAVQVYLESLARFGDPLPVGPELTVQEYVVPALPPHARVHNVTVPCPCPQMSGSR